ncbi:MAG: patatin-like phospholipase family protein, partial [Leptospira sp.]|nr:patatin-like phospholipase family protein [Leptospira sp.]
YVDGMPHWDGGVMMNTPLLPAIERDAKDIIVVLLSPVGGMHMNIPRSRREALERVFELSLIGSYQTVISDLNFDRSVLKSRNSFFSMIDFLKNKNDIRIRTVGPQNSLGLKSILNFSHDHADYLISRGYDDAKTQLGKV